ncbi:DMT family transporter [Aeromicrobium sp.]|uniref:DMT family transporter n=1 Tax=Aeromicrobium sp. TaxID=1871063 RepID=UPI003D6B24B0
MTPFLAIVAVLGVSASGPLMAGIAAPAFAIAFWRNAAATVLIAPVAVARSRAELSRLGRRHWMATALAGTALAAHFATWVSALKLTSVAAATALVAAQIVWVVLYDRMRGVRLAPLVVLGLGLAVAGVLVVTGVDFALSSRALAGDALAVAGGFFAAVYLVAGQSVRTRLSTTGYTVACYGICALILGVLCVATGTDLTGFSTRTWLLIAAVTVSAQLLGHSLLNHLLAVMSPIVISLLLLLEVPCAALLAGVFLGQSPAWGVYLGLAMILAGLAVVTSQRPPPSPVQAD